MKKICSLNNEMTLIGELNVFYCQPHSLIFGDHHASSAMEITTNHHDNN